MAEHEGILLGGEVIEGRITTLTRELLAVGRGLGNELGEPVSILFLGEEVSEVAQEAILLGADRSYVVGGPPWERLHPDYYAEVLAAVSRQIRPRLILLGQSDLGRDAAPRLAARLQTVVTLDCTEVKVDSETGRILQTRSVYGGKAMAVWTSKHEPQVITLRARAVKPAEPDASRSGEVVPLNIRVDESKVKGTLLQTVREPVKGVALEEAKVVVAGGGGIGGSEGFRMLEELAQLLGGAVGATRVPCDEGWVSSSLEIGQTGHVVSPDLYIAVGISGAPQHVVGCSNSKWIVAINRDPEAPIFRLADFGVVGDYREAIPALLEKLKELLSA